MMLLGEYDQTQAYRPWMTVDVRDTAECHMRLLESAEVHNGERYIAWSTDMVNVEDICSGIDRLLPEIGHDTPEPTEIHPERVQAREAELRAIWAGVEPRNDRIRAATGVEFRPFRHLASRLRRIVARRGQGPAETPSRVRPRHYIAGRSGV